MELLWNNKAEHTSNKIKRKCESERKMRAREKDSSSQMTAAAATSERVLFSLPLSETEKKKDEIRDQLWGEDAPCTRTE